MRIAIVGAGISGLTTAFYLSRSRPDWELAVFDAAPEPGGTMQTVSVAGFLFEAGGNGFLTNKPDTLRLVEDSGAQALLMPSSDLARRRFIYDGAAIHPLPESPPAFLRSRLLTLRQKLRVLGEPLVPARRSGAEESLQQFGYRRVGRGLTDVFLDAMTAGIYGTTPAKVSVEAAFPLVVSLEREHGGLFRGMLARRKKGAGPGGVLMSFRGGVGTFITHLRESIQADWRLGSAVRSVARGNGGWRLATDGGEERFDRVVVAAQAHAAAAMFAGPDPALAQLLRTIDYTPIAVVGLGYRALARPLEGFGLLTTSAARAPVMGILWDSSIFPDRAPAGCQSLRVMIGGQRNPELVDQDREGLLRTALAGVERIMGITQAPDVNFVRRWDQGIPHYAVGHLGRVSAIFDHLAGLDGLHLVSNAYHGIAMNDCTRNGRELAARILRECC
jgi:protoporphyrinogen/coproporphyrinogen III oxidase